MDQRSYCKRLAVEAGVEWQPVDLVTFEWEARLGDEFDHERIQLTVPEGQGESVARGLMEVQSSRARQFDDEAVTALVMVHPINLAWPDMTRDGRYLGSATYSDRFTYGTWW